jgi:hypothetical protein
VAKPNIKIIKGSGPTLSLAQLERASAKLLISRIRGCEPQVSFNFIQRLLDELICRRREEEKLKAELNSIVDDMEEVPESEEPEDAPEGTEDDSADFETLMSADIDVIESIDTTGDSSTVTELGIPEDLVLEDSSPLRAMVEPQEEEEEEEEEEEAVEERRPRRIRRKTPLASRHHSVLTELNMQRVLVLTMLAAFAMIFGVLIMGCGPLGPEGGLR